MDQQELQKNIALYYSKLSPSAQKVFSSMEWLQTLQTISTKYNLNAEQTQALGTETTLVLLGIIDVNEYEENLKQELLLAVEYPEKLIAEIKDSILSTVQPDLTEAFEANTKIQTPEGQKIEQELDERFDNLPESIKNIISESNYQTTLYDIAKNHGLNVIQMGTLEIIFIDLVNGAIRSDKFEEILKNKLQLPNEKTQTLAKDINEKILKEIRIKMVGLSKEEHKNDTQVLKSAGIEFVEQGETLPVPGKLELKGAKESHPVRSRPLEDESATVTSGRPASNGTHPILAQKLSGFTQGGLVETHHSLDNITKTNTPSPTDTKPKIPSMDPYREIPE